MDNLYAGELNKYKAIILRCNNTIEEYNKQINSLREKIREEKKIIKQSQKNIDLYLL